jgi:transcription termination factor NusB
MWSNPTRKILIGSIYEYLFWSNLGSKKIPEVDWTQLIDLYNTESFPLAEKELNSLYEKFLEKSETYIHIIQEHFDNWSKTYDIVKAILIVFVLELEDTNLASEKSIINKYLKITQELVGGQNPNLVHAVALKIYQNHTNKI